MASQQSQELARRAGVIYEQRLRAQLEHTHPDEFVAIGLRKLGQAPIVPIEPVPISEDGAADRFPGLFAGPVAALQQRHGFAESRMQDEQVVGVGDEFGRRPLPPFATVCG